MTHLQPILPGEIAAPVLQLTEPLSFWGGVDYLTGTIIDKAHPQHGACIAGTLLLVPMVRGSGGTPGTIASLMKIGLGPVAFVLGQPEINILAGVMLGQRLYDVVCPVFLADGAEFSAHPTGQGGIIQSDADWTLISTAPSI